MDVEQLMQLIDKVSGSDLTGFKYEENGVKVQLSKKADGGLENVLAGQISAQGNGVSQEISADSHSSKSTETGNLVKAPLVGTFYAAPAEDAAPFIQVGDSVKKGQSVAIIEAMKLMNEIESDYDGTVTEILVKNGQAVEYGQPLFRIA